MTGPWIAGFAALSLLVVVLAVVVTGILRRSNATLERLDDYMKLQARTREMSRRALGTAVPEFSSHDIQGRLVSSQELFADRSLVLFLGGSCEPCDDLVEEMMSSEVDLGPVRLVLAGRLETVTKLVERFGAASVVGFADTDTNELSQAFDNRVIPQAFVVDPPGVLVAADIPNNIRDLERLAGRVEGVSARS